MVQCVAPQPIYVAFAVAEFTHQAVGCPGFLVVAQVKLRKDVLLCVRKAWPSRFKPRHIF